MIWIAVRNLTSEGSTQMAWNCLNLSPTDPDPKDPLVHPLVAIKEMRC